MNHSEIAISFDCESDQLIGIISQPAVPNDCGVVIVVGGPQYRIGSHRQFVLLARFLATEGITTLRFDYRGMGDSSGEFRDFNAVDMDMRAAIDALQRSDPRIKRVVIWGLCDAASAALFYAPTDQRIIGLVLANPWVRTSTGQAQAVLTQYYRSRLLDRALWKKVLTGQFDFKKSISSLARVIRRALAKESSREPTAELPLRERMYVSWASFSGKVLLLISGEDLTAKEFMDMVSTSAPWRALVENPRVSVRQFPSASHTFSRSAWRDEVAAVTANWVIGL